jgi:heat shock protein HslJ
MKKILLIVSIIVVAAGCSPKLSPDSNWGRQRWVLTDLKGVPVQQSGTNRDAFIEFIPAEKRFTGNGGCNRMSGNYTLEKKNDIRFGQVLSTKMSCADIAFETAFLSALNDINRYEVTGNSMLLKDGNKVLLIFQSK